MSDLLPHDLVREERPPEEAASGKASQISSFDRQHIFECTQCIEYRPTDPTYSGLPQTR